jgi:hypothetical protein
MTWLRVWLPESRAEDVASQRYVVTRLLNAGVLADDVAGSLRGTAHVLAAVADAQRLATSEDRR